MRLKVFRAPAMAEAMAAIRAELGAEALILSTRRCAGGVEVTAALEPPEPPAPLRPEPCRLAWHGVPDRLAGRLRGPCLSDALADTLRFAPLDLAGEAPPKLLVGPPGAGKTLTAARLATRLVLAGQAPLVVTTDGRRAGGAEELAAYTRLLSLDLLVADEPATLALALERREPGSAALIDTAGINPFDARELAALSAFGRAAGAELALVLPAGLDPAEAADIARAFAAIGTTHLIATRLDLARRAGSILAAADAAGLILAEAGIGTEAPDGLVPFTPALLAERLAAGARPEPAHA
jgi:flagellar biosynthesis protein FlhF